jgi:hypothetical protein
VEKFVANGEFDKIKARLVANGAHQKQELYSDRSSPTASIHAIFTCLALVACIGEYDVAEIDIKGAYIQTEITGSPIYMKMDKKLTSAIISVLPNLKDFDTPEGTLCTKLLKALYCCIQSGQLWYARIKKVLLREGYSPRPTDPCFIRCIEDKRIFILILYVNDILLFASLQEIECVKTYMMKEFQWITVVCDKIQSNLGMSMHIQEHQVVVYMKYYTRQLLQSFTNLKQYATPAIKECFEMESNAKFFGCDG